MAAGQIGVDHVRVKKILKNIFKIAGRWGAILLLDEADVFLAERALDPHTNALVSVFLRELEHYEGILFLTTNRMQTLQHRLVATSLNAPNEQGHAKTTATCPKPWPLVPSHGSLSQAMATCPKPWPLVP